MDLKMDVLMDIELPVTLRFGRTQMQLGEVLALGAGSTIEFDRGAHEIVEVLINGRVVARGEAVMVQGNYGVRISEITNRGRINGGPDARPDVSANGAD